MILKDIIEMAVDNDQITMGTKVILDDGRGIANMETGWDEETDQPVLYLFPEEKEPT